MEEKINQLIKKLQLKAHPEGGFYRETFRSTLNISAKNLPQRFGSRRSMATSILFLLRKGEFSRFHQLKQDEIWYYHTGSPMCIHCICMNGEYKKSILGISNEVNAQPQIIIHATTLFAAEPLGDYSLAGCATAPGFDFEDLNIPSKQWLLAEYPQHAEIIRSFGKG